jgi:release factor glutamine methyltransferase
MKNKLFETNTLKLNDIIALGQKYLLDCNIVNAKQEIEWFLIDKFKFDISDIKLNSNKYLSIVEKKQFFNFIHDRGLGKPFQYILNKCNFYGYDFYVNSDTLIPRPETELIIDLALKKNHIFNQCLDIGVGSGNLSITLLLKNIVNKVDAVDISSKALSVAKKNSKIYMIDNIDFYQLNILEYKFNKRYDLIVSNPPYITNADYKKLPREIKEYEPPIALTDFDNGLKFYKKIFKQLHNILNKKGVLLIEIGLENTKETINSIFSNNDFTLLWHKDLNGDYRVLEVQRNV